MRALLVINEKSRHGARDGPRVCSILEGLGIECLRDARARELDAVIAAGGDGTVTSTAPIAIAGGVPLAIVPLGTFNDLAKTLGVPAGIEAACRAVLSGRFRTIDVGRVNGAHFVNEASIGLSARIARRQTPEVKQRFGFLGIVSTTLQGLRDANAFPVELKYGARTERFRTIQLTVANNAHFGGIFDSPTASIEDGLLDLYSVEPSNPLQAFGIARKIVAKDPSSGDGLRARHAPCFAVRTRRPHHVSADGEPAGTTPATFEVLPRALRICMP